MPTTACAGRSSATRDRRRPRRVRARGAGRTRRPLMASSRPSVSTWRAEPCRAPAPSALPDRELAASRGRSRQHQVGDVGARDEQHEADGAEQHQQRAADVADEILAQRDEAMPLSLSSFGYSCASPCAMAVISLWACSCERRLQAPTALHPHRHGTVQKDRIFGRRWEVPVDVAIDRDVAGGDADHRVSAPIEHERPARHASGLPPSAPSIRRPEHHCGRAAAAILVRGEAATDDRLDVERSGRRPAETIAEPHALRAGPVRSG